MKKNGRDSDLAHEFIPEKDFDGKKHLKEIKDIFLWMSKTFSQIKLYSINHPSVSGFIDILYEKLSSFLDKNWKLELTVTETSFYYQEDKVFEEKQLIRSLPFVFFKDGIQNLFFYKGINKEELREFLEIIKMVSHLPPEESDIVTILWEKDFPSIRYYAPDEFLESKIGLEVQIPEYKVDRRNMTSGIIKIDSEKNGLIKAKEFLEKSNGSIISDEAEFSPEFLCRQAELNDKEAEALEAMINKSRSLSQEEETTHLLIEILFLEERIEPFAQTLETLKKFLEDFLNKVEFSPAAHIMQHLVELKNELKFQSSPKVVFLDNFFEALKKEETLDKLSEILIKNNHWDEKRFFEYLSYIGSAALPMISKLYNLYPSPAFRKEAHLFLRKTEIQDFSELIKIADDTREPLTMEIISILEKSKDNKAITYLASLLSFKKKSIRLRTIEALGKFKTQKSNRIILSFLDDIDKDIRTCAARNIPLPEDKESLAEIIKRVCRKSFHKKTPEEKSSFLDVLSSINTKESLSILQDIIKGIGFFSKKSKKETGLCAIDSLKRKKPPFAENVLEEGIKSRNKAIRLACREALSYMKSSFSKRNSN